MHVKRDNNNNNNNNNDDNNKHTCGVCTNTHLYNISECTAPWEKNYKSEENLIK